MNPITIASITILIAVIGALPFGLVNLSVLETAYRSGLHPALKVAHGASWIEVLYGITALLAGSIIAKAIDNSPVVKYVAVILPLITGLFFLFRNNQVKQSLPQKKQGLLKGVVLNLLSVQVLLYWIASVTWLKTNYLSELTPVLIVLFIASVWVGKMGVLWLYAQYSQFILSKSGFLVKNINRIIGLVLILSGLIQFKVKFIS